MEEYIALLKKALAAETETVRLYTCLLYTSSAAYLTKYYGNERGGISAADPLHTVTAKDREAVTAAFLSKFYKTGVEMCIRDRCGRKRKIKITIIVSENRRNCNE